jgi:putative ABC transport system ATP-binding protein
MPSLAARDLFLAYRLPDGSRPPVLDLPAFDAAAGETVAVTGPSGSGKTSLLHVLCGLERPARGHVRWGATEITALGEGARDRWRRRHVGFVFQDFHLFSGLDALGNVLLPARFERAAVPADLRRRASDLLERVGLGDGRCGKGARDIATLSRGQMQRVAVARALLFAPPVVLADEPTASLDPESAASVTGLLLDLVRESGGTLIAVTHDPALIRRLDTVYRLDGGRFAAPAVAEDAR